MGLGPRVVYFRGAIWCSSVIRHRSGFQPMSVSSIIVRLSSRSVIVLRDFARPFTGCFSALSLRRKTATVTMKSSFIDQDRSLSPIATQSERR